MTSAKDPNALTTPKVFISYSWTSPQHKEMIKEWADRLVGNGVDVVLDLYNLQEGDDKYVFMEQAVTDSSVTHVLLMCDKLYADKADGRQGGVGTETQIISKEVYQKVKQAKFIPIACEADENGKWCFPTYLESRIGIDFTSPEKVNENWEQLLRSLFGKPLYVKPALGKPPAFLHEDSVAASPAIAKFAALKHAILNGKPAVDLYRQEFLDACIEFADAMRVRVRPDGNYAERLVADCGKLKLVRDHVIDWVLLEAKSSPGSRFQEELLNFLERLLELKARPKELTTWSDVWFEAHKVFVYETFLYIVAGVLKAGACGVLHELFTHPYMQPEGSQHYGNGEFSSFDCFWTHGEALKISAPDGSAYLAPAAELVKRQADRTDLPFKSVMEADLLILLMAFASTTASWRPATLYYARHQTFPFFLRATQHTGFQKLAVITGIGDAEKLRALVATGQERLGVNKWHNFWPLNFSQLMNLEKLDSLK